MSDVRCQMSDVRCQMWVVSWGLWVALASQVGGRRQDMCVATWEELTYDPLVTILRKYCSCDSRMLVWLDSLRFGPRINPANGQCPGQMLSFGTPYILPITPLYTPCILPVSFMVPLWFPYGTLMAPKGKTWYSVESRPQLAPAFPND